MFYYVTEIVIIVGSAFHYLIDHLVVLKCCIPHIRILRYHILEEEIKASCQSKVVSLKWRALWVFWCGVRNGHDNIEAVAQVVGY